MIGNYAKIALRNLARNKLHAGINVLGLSVALVCSILILLYIQDELSYDKHHEYHGRIHKLAGLVTVRDTVSRAAVVPFPLGPTLKDEYPGVEKVVRFFRKAIRGRYGEKAVNEESVYCVDETIFDVFTHRFLKGSARNALVNPNTVVLTARLAEKYFGDENPIGKVIQQKDSGDLRITGVIEDPPASSHLRFDALISMSTLAASFGRDVFHSRESGYFWSFTPIGYMHTYLLMRENAPIDGIMNDFSRFHEKYFRPAGRGMQATFRLMATPLARTHFRTDLESGLPAGNFAYVYIFATIAVFILMIASINHMNMSTARAERRAKEIRIRYAIGASKQQIFGQFLLESMVIATVAMVIASLLSEALLPAFNQLTGRDIRLFSSANVPLFSAIVVLSAALGLVSGTYPAFYLASSSSFGLRNIYSESKREGRTLRSVLVTLQFTLSMIVIAGTLLVSKQFDHLKSAALGFDKTDVMIIPIRDAMLYAAADALKAELLKHPAVERVARSSSVPGLPLPKPAFRFEREGEMKTSACYFMYVDHDYVDLMGIEIKKGRPFSRDTDAEGRTGFIVNEALVRANGWQGEALGKRAYHINHPNSQEGSVIGVAKNFNFGSLHRPVEPFVFILRDLWRYFISVRIQPGRSEAVIQYAKKALERVNVDYPLEYFFLEDTLNEHYTYEERMRTIFVFFSIVCVSLCSIGILGLSSYAMERRTKEVGIRKVLGASVAGLVVRMATQFIALAAFAGIIAWPISHFAVTRWLENYPYRTNVGIWPFAAAGALALVIAVVTAGYQALRAASADPIASLRSE